MGVSILEIVAKGIPESLLVVLCVFYFCNIKPNVKQLVIILPIHIVSMFLSRLLMPGYGLSLLVNVVVVVVVFHFCFEIPMSKIINGSLLCILFIIISEAINFLVIQVFFPDKLDQVLYDPSTRIIYTIPSTVLFGLQVLGVYYFNIIRKKKEDG